MVPPLLFFSFFLMVPVFRFFVYTIGYQTVSIRIIVRTIGERISPSRCRDGEMWRCRDVEFRVSSFEFRVLSVEIVVRDMDYSFVACSWFNIYSN